MKGDKLLIGLTVATGALPAVIYLIYAEKVVDYCGHANILIICFVCYILEYTGKCIFMILLTVYTTITCSQIMFYGFIMFYSSAEISFQFN